MYSNDKALQLFKYSQNNVRIITKEDGSIWFAAVDVCKVLSLRNITEALRGLDSDELSSVILKSGRQNREITIISESGLYSLIFKSRKQEARDFSRWVRREVLPAVRQHGFYVNDKKINSLNSQDEIIKEVLTELKFTREENRRLRSQIETDRVKVAFSDFLMGTPGSITFQEAAIFLTQHGIKNIGQNNLFKLFRERGLLCSRRGKQWNKPTNKAVQLGYFCLEVSGSDGRNITLITHKFLMKLLDEFTQEQFPIIHAFTESQKGEN